MSDLGVVAVWERSRGEMHCLDTAEVLAAFALCAGELPGQAQAQLADPLSRTPTGLVLLGQIR